MKLYEKVIRSGVILFIASIYLQLLAVSAVASEFPIALSENIEKQFREFITVLGDMNKSSNGEFSYYEKSPVNLREVIEQFPIEKFKALIVTTSELENIQGNLANNYIIEDGRKLDIEFYLVGRQAKALLNIHGPIVVYSHEESIMNFYRDIFTGCLYHRRLASNNWPTRKYRREDLSGENLEKCDIVILKHITNINRLVGKELMYDIWRVTEFPNIPIHYCDTSQSDDKDELESCLEEVSRDNPNMPQYSFRVYPKLDRFTTVFGINEEPLSRQLGRNWCVQVVAKEEMVKIVYPAGYKERIREFWNLLYRQLNTISWKYARDKDNEQLKSLKDDYANTIYLLTSKMRGIIAAADIIYIQAQYEYELIDKLYGYYAIQQKLSKSKPLEDTEMSVIVNLNKIFQGYFNRRAELPKERVDLNLLHAKRMVTRLEFFLHQHYYNLGSNFMQQSVQHLNNAKERLNSLSQDLESVKQKDDFDYQSLRNTDLFQNVIEQYKKLKPILNIS